MIERSEVPRHSQSNNKVVVRKIPNYVDEAEFTQLASNFSKHILWMRFHKSSKKTPGKCFIQLDSPQTAQEFLSKFNGPLLDAKGKEFTPEAELCLFQGVPPPPVSCNRDFYESEEYLGFQEEDQTSEDFSEQTLTPQEAALVTSIHEEEKKKPKKKRGRPRRWHKRP